MGDEFMTIQIVGTIAIFFAMAAAFFKKAMLKKAPLLPLH
jgi:hypothetical protein